MTNADEWQNRVGQVWADLFPRTDRAFAGLTQMLLEKLASVPGGAIADVGCGAGELSLALAAARPYADVCGIDISEALLARARERAAGAGNVRFVSGDAAQWQPGDRFRPDLLVSRHGVMFFDDPVAAFAHLRAVAAADARMVFTCFRAAAGNVWASGMAHALDLPPPGDPDAPGPFAFAEEDRVRSILTRAGWRDIVLEPADFSFVTGGGLDPVADSLFYFQHIGPAARFLHELDDADRRAALLRKLEQWLRPYRSGDVVAFPAQAWIVSARRRD